MNNSETPTHSYQQQATRSERAPQLIAWPLISGDDMRAVEDVMERSVFVKGPIATQLEEAFAQYIRVRHCRAVSSCTHAIHLALRAIDIGPGDEVLVPNLTYCGTVSPVVNCGATPVFVDVNEHDYNISASDAVAKRTCRTKAVIPVHLHGYPCDVHALCEALPELPIVEDACQAHGASRHSEHAGSWGIVSCFSLNQVKPLCGGQGGLVVTNSPDVWARLTDLASPGRNDTIGLSYEITELSAAIAASQLRRLDNILDVAQRNYALFTQCIDAQYRGIVQPCADGVRPTWHKLRLRMPSSLRDRLVAVLDREGVPYDTWPGTLVSERSEYRHLTAITPLSTAIMQSSFVLGNETYPFHAQTSATIEHWASIINSELRLSGKADL